MTVTYSRLYKISLIIGVTAIVMLAIAVTLARILLPYADQYKSDVEQWVGATLKHPVKIDAMRVYWRGFGPRADLEGVAVLNDARNRTLLHLGTMSVGFDVFSYLRHGRLLPRHIAVEGLRLSVVRRADGTFSINEISVNQDENDKEIRALIKNWLLQNNRMMVKVTEIRWHDETARLPDMKFSDILLDFNNSGERHRVYAALRLPVNLGNHLTFYGDVEGDLFQPENWSGRFYFRGEGLRAEEWMQHRQALGLAVRGAIVDVELWSDWQRANLMAAEGKLNALMIRLAQADGGAAAGGEAPTSSVAKEVLIPALQTNFHWERTDQGWTLDADRFSMASARGMAPPAALSIKFARLADDVTQLEAGVSLLRLQDFMEPLLMSDVLSGAAREMLTAMAPNVELNNAYVRYRDNGAQAPPAYLIHSGFRDAEVNAWKKIPGIKGLDGSMDLKEGGGVLDLASVGTSINFGKLFRGPITADTMDGRIAWEITPEGWKIKTDKLRAGNKDIKVECVAGLEKGSPEESPLVDLVAVYSNGRVAAARNYLPVAIMPAGTVRWLDKALVSGKVMNGAAVLRGRLADFPYDHHEGRFQVLFNVGEGVLDYAEGWPRIEEIETEVEFSGRGLEVNAVSGKMFGADIHETRVAVADLGGEPAVVSIRGTAVGPLEDGLRLLRESPLNVKFGKQVEDMMAAGQGRLSLETDLPLSDDPARVKGDIQLKDNALRIGEDFDLAHINGLLEFSNAGLSARGIQAEVLGQPAQIDIRTLSGPVFPVQQQGTLFQAQGKAALVDIKTHFPSSFWDYVKGEANWTASLRLPATPAGISPTPVLRIESSLQGVTVSVPEPLGKTAAQIKPLMIETRLPLANAKSGVLRYGNDVKARYFFKKVRDKTEFDRGEIHFGGAEAVLPESSGLRIAGELKHFASSDWKEFVPVEDKRGKPSAPLINEIALKLKELDLFKRRYNDVRLNAEYTPEAWVANVSGPQVSGVIRLPHDKAQAITMNMENLTLATLPKEEKSMIDPRELQPVRISAARFVYGDLDLGSFNFSMVKVSNGVHFDQIQIAAPSLNVAATGDWTYDKQPSSRFDIKFDSDDLGNAFSRFGYANAIRDGKAESSISVQWPGAANDFSFEHLNGSVHVWVGKGRLLEIDPGAARIFGLLSFQALPRRLSLDFSDFFKKGFAFDEIKGDFVIKDGNANTDNLYMKGPAGRVEVKGRVGLAAQDYDQRVAVIPQLTSSLPLAGMIVGGVGGAAAALLAEKLIKPGVEDITRIEYTVTGSWNDPVVNRVHNKH